MTDTPTIEAEVPQKRTRGRPPGKYGRYRKLDQPNKIKSESIKSESQLLNGPELNEGPPRRKKGPGSGKPAPTIVINSANMQDYFPPPPRKIGAPSTYTEEMADRICEWIAQGKSLRSFCLLEDTPDHSTVYDWMEANPVFYQKYARAKHKGIDVMAEQTVDVSSVLSRPPEQIQAARLAFDARKWYLSKVAPKVWGDKVEVHQEISGPGGGPIEFRVQALIGLIEDPAIADRLADHHLAAIREAALLLAAPAAGVGSRSAGDGAGAIIEGETSEMPAED
jgi:hypothetical protein